LPERAKIALESTEKEETSTAAVFVFMPTSLDVACVLHDELRYNQMKVIITFPRT